ncbi:uncharacterized protein MKK02DRAFT_43553 [Dioszegia hungarica]|uniref:J domain-containing protein n=1 Tax=Dioszegia hungarica TaxID=4972 RepID=A0AA38HCT0_9TREE|nr:uncharacterized protein MKK02DRAFT_43553 [Dioszegia hungarica]KAI9637627.1 hypothetical protein MKK02DRAFT_43553 [Dioszegia hungarica]
MDDHPDPILNFYSEKEAEEPDALYIALTIARTATPEDVRKAYRKLALKYHPDKHGSKGEDDKERMGKEFQKIGFAYAVLSDEGRRKRYDANGKTAENAFTDAEEMGWDAYFESLFQRVDRKMLDDHKEKYQDSQDELDDLEEAYNKSEGSLPSILQGIPHATHEDESRLIGLVEDLISSGKLERTKAWTKSSKDQTAAKARGKKASKEAKEAEQAAKELGVWDEFYGNGEKGKRNGNGGTEEAGKGKGKGKAKGKEAGGGEDALAALILKRQRDRDGGLDAMAAKYARMEEDAREKKRAKKGGKATKEQEQENEEPPEISDADFEALQAKMFGGKGGAAGSKGKKGRA